MKYMNYSKALEVYSSQEKADLIEVFCIGLTIIVGLLGYSKIIPASIGVLIAFFLVSLRKPELLIGPLLFTTVFDDYLVALPNQSFSRFLALFLLLFTAVKNLRNGKYILYQKKASLYIFALIVMGCILSIWGVFGYTAFPVTFVLNLSIAFVLCNYTSNTNLVKRQLLHYSIISVIYLAYLLAQNGFSSIFSVSRVHFVETANNNQTAQGLAIIGSIFIGIILTNSKRNWRNYLFLIITIIGVFLTGSRSALIAIILTVLLISVIGKPQQIKYIVITWVGGIVATIIIYRIMSTYFPMILQRFTYEKILSTGGTNRLNIWKSFFSDYFSKYWLFGIGFDARNTNAAIFSSIGVDRGAHNIVIEALASSGIAGLILYCLFFIHVFKEFFRTKSRIPILIVPIGMIICTLINGIGENTLTNRLMCLAIGIGFMLLNGEKENNESRTE